MKDLNNKTVLITGASRGIGRYIVSNFISLGAKVIGVARSQKGLEETADIVTSGGGRFFPFSSDLKHVEQLEDLVTKINADVGSVDILVNNAGVEFYQYFHQNTFNMIQSILSVNLHAAMELTRLLLPDMLSRSGHIVNISSLAGKKGIAYNSIYSATKAALITWTDALRQELADTSVNISVICPGYISEAGMFHNSGINAPALLGTSKPQDVADAVINAVINNRVEIIVNNGPMKPLLAINQLYPAFGDKVVKWFGVPELSKGRIWKDK